jgi:LysR family transcriptional regulator (chromosome initiation inhibitor)
MRFETAHLETLVAVIDEGTFEGAARQLHLTPSAVSQRIRGLERAAGRVLIRRTTPTSITTAGEPLLRLGRQLRLLSDEAAADLGAAIVLELDVAVNADSLASWFRPVLSALTERPSTALRLHVEDQGYSHDLLRRGEVLAAVTSEPRPVQGCLVEPLGSLRYRPAAAPALLERYRRGARGVDWSAIPMLEFNDKDQLQSHVLTAHGAVRPPVVHRVPSTHDFHDAIRRGLGWGLIPETDLEPDLLAGHLARMPGTRPVDVPLYWQRWRIDSPSLNTLTTAVRRAASDGLRTTSTRRSSASPSSRS